jgi:hypothetical protein
MLGLTGWMAMGGSEGGLLLDSPYLTLVPVPASSVSLIARSLNIVPLSNPTLPYHIADVTPSNATSDQINQPPSVSPHSPGNSSDTHEYTYINSTTTLSLSFSFLIHSSHPLISLNTMADKHPSAKAPQKTVVSNLSISPTHTCTQPRKRHVTDI